MLYGIFIVSRRRCRLEANLPKAERRKMKIKYIYDHYKNVISYLFFGFCTTAINVAVYGILSHAAGCGVMFSTIAAWIIAVLFAYLTNRKWVFSSHAENFITHVKEITSFFLCRIATGVIDWGCMFLFVNIFHFNDVIIKIISNFIVIILNYVLSKCIVFRCGGRAE